MCYIRDILFATEVDKKDCDLQSVPVSWEIIPAAFLSSYRQLVWKTKTNAGDSSNCLERLKCALRYVIRLGSKAWCEDYFETNKKGKTFLGNYF